MERNTKELSEDQKTRIYNSLPLRDSDFLTTCIYVLAPEGGPHSSVFSQYYDKLARRACSKVDTIEGLLSHFGYSSLQGSPDTTIRYDLKYLLGFAEGDQQRFVSMLFELAAVRSPSPDEALQFEQLLISGHITRRDACQQILERFAQSFSIEDEEVLSLPHLDDNLSVCQTWRDRLYFHPQVTAEANFDEQSRCFEAKSGLVFSCDLHLLNPGEWRLHYKLLNHGPNALQIDARDLQRGEVLCSASAAHDLEGMQFLTMPEGACEVQISITSIEGRPGGKSTITPVEIRLSPGTS